MPTDKPKLSAYVPQILKDRLIEFKNDRGLSSESEALTVILAEYFGIEGITSQSTDRSVIGGVTLVAFEEMKAAIADVLDRVEHLEFTGGLQASSPSSKGDPLQLPLLSSPSTAAIKPISGVKLSFRFNLNKGVVSQNKQSRTSQEFTEWTRKKDPDNIAWKFVQSPAKGYVPDGELSKELHSRLLKWIEENLL